MKDFVRALFLVSAFQLSAGAGLALAETVSVQEPADAKKAAEPADAKKPEGAAPAEAQKPAETAKPAETPKPAEVAKPEEPGKPDDAKKPTEAKKPGEAPKSAKLTKSTEIYQSSPKFLGKKLAVGGYDTVAYHKGGKPVIGTDEFTHTWKDATWRFSSKENLEAFVADPEKYAPQYGGYCAFAVAHNGLSPGSPLHWKIVDGKLYLNIDGSVQTKWERGQDGFIKRGDSNWPKVLPSLQPKLVKK
jgi:YHS domain-containing protein